MTAPFSSFTAKCELGFLNTGKRFLRGSVLKPTEAACVLLKTVLGIFKIALRLTYRHVFMRQSVETLNVFNTLTLKQNFLVNEDLFPKTGVPFYS